MIGDRLETDIKFGQQIGCATLLVLSGVHGLLDVTRTQIVPDYVMDSLGDLEKSKSFLGGVLHTHDV
ncbi:cytochrome c oxidase subunit 1 [Coelomomyces lativittatus]|nr:cytochrome c oxidase subunit 1 [Coelomomyces lativittatus]KAJ1503451.1 HAD-super hydrolase, sub IIA [Coelomomyces lativittatus]